MSRTDIPSPQQIYRHFKGNLYQINCIAYDSETAEEMVVYQALYGDYRFYVRPLKMFMSEVDKIKYPDAPQKYRFEEVNVNSSVEKSGKVVNTEIRIERDENTEVYSEDGTDPDVVKFWDADTYARRIEILDTMKYKITNDMIDLMATVIDIDLKEDDDPQRRFEAFRDALTIRKTYETNRLR